MKNKPINNYSKVDIIQNVLEGDLDVFLKRLYKQSHYQLTYSVTLRKWRKEGLELVNYIKKRKMLPGLMNDLCNIHLVMVEYYDSELTIESFKLTERLEDVLTDYIWKYCTDKLKDDLIRKGKDEKFPKKKEALRELKKRGFVNVNDFEDFDSDMGHITTNHKIENRLYYPMNFKVGSYMTNDPDDLANPSVEIAHKFVGVKGFTRILTKRDR